MRNEHLLIPYFLTHFKQHKGMTIEPEKKTFLRIKNVLDNSGCIAYNSNVKAIAIIRFAWPLRNGCYAVTLEGGKYNVGSSCT